MRRNNDHSWTQPWLASRVLFASFRFGVVPLASFAFVLLLETYVWALSSYTYDQLGRLTTEKYDNGLCIGYVYDANGNRTAITTIATATEPPTWGSATWGCFVWTPQ